MSDYRTPAVELSRQERATVMPLLGFGTWQISDADVTVACEQALAAGYRHIDTATRYENEAGIGRALATASVPRNEMFLTSKLAKSGVGRERQALEETLTQLGLDHLDLWLVHWPPGGEASPQVWEQLAVLQSEGLTTHIGVSNYSLDQIDEITRSVGVGPAVNQIKWSPTEYRKAIAEGHAERDIVIEGYSPFRASNLNDPVLLDVADRYGVSTPQIIIAWHVAHQVPVIPKTVQPERMASNAAGAKLTLSADDIAEIDALGS